MATTAQVIPAQGPSEAVYPSLVGLPIFFRFIEAGQLKADPEYQRSVKPKLVQRIVMTFNPRALGCLRVGERGGDLWIEDGLQRWTAVMRLDPTYQLACMVYADSSVEREAEDFWIVNHNRQSLLPHEMFKARLKAGDPAAHNIMATVAQLGLEVKWRTGPLRELQVECITLLDQLYADNLLTKVLSIAIDAWGHRSARAFSRPILAGIRDFHRQYQSTTDRGYQREFLVTALHHTTPELLTQTAYQIGVTGRAYKMARAIWQQYNEYAPRRRRLIDWSQRTAERKEWYEGSEPDVVRFRGNYTPRMHEEVRLDVPASAR